MGNYPCWIALTALVAVAALLRVSSVQLAHMTKEFQDAATMAANLRVKADTLHRLADRFAADIGNPDNYDGSLRATADGYTKQIAYPAREHTARLAQFRKSLEFFARDIT